MPQSTPVHEAIEQHLADTSLHHAILVDPALGDPFAEQRNRDGLIVNALPLPEEKATPELRPYLVPVQIGDPILERSIALAQEEATAWHAGTGHARSICGWLSYTGDTQPLAQALGQKATLILDETQTLLFRYYDPRVTTHLLRWLSQGQFFNGLPVLQHWAYLNTEQKLGVLSQGDASASIAPVWFMTAAQRQGIARIEALNATLSGLGNDVRHADAIVHALGHAADRYGLTDTADLVAFATQAVQCHPRFDQHPSVVSALAELAKHGDSIADWFDHQSEATWQRIAADLERANHRD